MRTGEQLWIFHTIPHEGDWFTRRSVEHIQEGPLAGNSHRLDLTPVDGDVDQDLVLKEPRVVMGPQELPLFKPPWGRLVAIDLNKGEVLWTAANGDGPRDHPAIGHLDLPPLGHGGCAAPLVTKTLVFMGEGANIGAAFIPPGGGNKTFRAYDKATGELVRQMDLPGGTTAAPMSYMVDGRQFIVGRRGLGRHGERVCRARPPVTRLADSLVARCGTAEVASADSPVSTSPHSLRRW